MSVEAMMPIEFVTTTQMGENGEVTEVELLASLPEAPGASLSAITRILPKLIRCTPELPRRRKQQ
jgi:hypothetical protein